MSTKTAVAQPFQLDGPAVAERGRANDFAHAHDTCANAASHACLPLAWPGFQWAAAQHWAGDWGPLGQYYLVRDLPCR